MAIPTKESSQDKAANKVDREMKKPKKEIPLMERDFKDLLTLKEQFEWLKLKQSQDDQKFLQNNK